MTKSCTQIQPQGHDLPESIPACIPCPAAHRLGNQIQSGSAAVVPRDTRAASHTSVFHVPFPKPCVFVMVILAQLQKRQYAVLPLGDGTFAPFDALEAVNRFLRENSTLVDQIDDDSRCEMCERKDCGHRAPGTPEPTPRSSHIRHGAGTCVVRVPLMHEPGLTHSCITRSFMRDRIPRLNEDNG